MKKTYSQMNEFDNIILCHQENINDLEELTELRYEKWKESYEKYGKKVSDYYDKKSDRIVLRYLVIDDSINKRWAIYDSSTKKIIYFNWGELSILLLNSLILYSPENVYFKKYYDQFISMGGSDDDYNNWQKITRECIDELNKLFIALSTLNDYRKIHSETDTEKYTYSLWLDYRYCTKTKLWASIVNSRNATEKDFARNCSWADNDEIKKIVNGYHEHAQEEEEMLHDIVTKELFIYHDFMVVSYDDNSIISGNAYVAVDIMDIFSLDLLHVLKNDTETPRKCPRCGQLYFSNNNKSKYCNECRTQSNVIRQENRKNNPCRYLHKQITDLLNLYYDDTTEFRIESNYYWAIITGKKPKQIPPSYNKDIKTEASYMKWLEDYKTKHLKS